MSRRRDRQVGREMEHYAVNPFKSIYVSNSDGFMVFQ
jgi:hypothetical protein